MVSRCETIAKFVLPVFRSLVAKELIEKFNLSQTEVAKKLQTTQASISHYVNWKRGVKTTGQFDEMLPQIQSLAAKTAQRIVSGETTWPEIALDFCKFCSFLIEERADKSGSNYSI